MYAARPVGTEVRRTVAAAVFTGALGAGCLTGAITNEDLEFLKMVRERIVHLELADLGGPLGKGKVAFDRLIPELKNVAVNVWTSLDLIGFDDPFTAAADVKRLVEKWRRKYT